MGEPKRAAAEAEDGPRTAYGRSLVDFLDTMTPDERAIVDAAGELDRLYGDDFEHEEADLAAVTPRPSK